MAKVGYFYDKGLGGLNQDKKEALKWYKKIGKEDKGQTLYMLALNFYFGIYDQEPDEKRCLQLYKLSAEFGYTDALYSIAGLYDYGRGVIKKDEKKALKY